MTGKKTVKSTEKLKPKKTFGEYVSNSVVIHFFVLFFIIQNGHYFIPKIIDEKARIAAIESTRDVYRESMRTSVENMQKIHQVLTEMENIEQDKLTNENRLQAHDEMSTADLFNLSNELLTHMSQRQAEQVPELISDLKDNVLTETETVANAMSDSEMLEKMQENQKVALTILDELQRRQQGSGVRADTEGEQPQLTVDSDELEAGNATKRAEQADDSTLHGHTLNNKEVEQLLQQQKNVEFSEQHAKGQLKDFTQAMSEAYGKGSQYRFDDIVTPKSVKPQNVPSINQSNTRMASHKLTSNASQSAKWIMLDTWYVIGPFENAQRKHIHTSYPPEQTINLDGQYVGKDQQVIGWRYRQFSNFPIVPENLAEYEIYYAYTQLKSDRAQDVWLAIGSDDQSKLWLNDMLVWNSLPQHKGWQLSEGFRKVRLKKGVNPLLFRLENGQRSGGFSVAMSSVMSSTM
ncbi:hypothetical protein [Algibacillus agarilyticus]|uniref:hypothetical protein n=1 Tax=Algibacillus agarilyticus TaxID=2234133 RepID=UPI000DD06BD5|nr:hypothetical protein [Algibacillus agarilyticus]